MIFAITLLIPSNLKQEGEWYSQLLRSLSSKKARSILLVTGVILSLVTGVFFYANPGTAYAVQYLWGGDAAVTSQGVKVKLFGRLIPISFEIAFQDTLGEMTENDEIFYRKAQRWEFADAISANIATSLVVGINYADEEAFLVMADKNRSEDKLVWARIIPVYDQALKNTAKLMDAQDYISGASSQFDYYLRDQLENGMYITEEIFREDEAVTLIGDTSTQRTVVTDRPLKSAPSRERQKKFIIKRDTQGNALRDTSNTLKKYGLTIVQAAVTKIDWEDSFDDRLDLQKEQVAKTQLEKQEAEKEYYANLKAVQMGERKKTERQKELEKDQIEKTISAETAAKVAIFKVQEERELLAAAKLTAQRIEVTSDAEASQNRKLVSAGLTPQERAQNEKEIAIGVAEALAKMATPNTVIIGGSGSGKGSGITESLIQAAMAKELTGSKK